VFAHDVADRHVTLLVTACANFTLLGPRLLVGAVVPLVLVTFEATKSTVGVALAGLWVAYALAQFPSGLLGDRHGERRLVVLALVCTTASAVLVAGAPTLPLFGAFLVVLGGGSGLFFSPASSLVSRLYDDHGGALGLLTASGGLAGVVYPAVGGAIGVRFGWRTAVALGGLVVVPVLVVVLRTTPTTRPENPDSDLRVMLAFGRHRDLLSRPRLAYSTLLALIVSFTFQSLASFFPTFLVEYRGLETDLAGVAFGAVFALSSTVQPVAGRVSDRYSRDLAIGISVSLALVGLVVLLAVPSRAGLIAGTGFLGVGVSWPGPVQARVFDLLGDDERGYGWGLIRTVYLALGASGSIVVGTLADASGWSVGFGAVAVVLLTCLGLLAGNHAFRLGL
jgi:MFS family permease